MNRYERCACHSKLPYHKCCMPLHQGTPAPTAQALMRSRFAAYALGLADYIMDTTHPTNLGYMADRGQWQRQILDFTACTRFDGLRILEFIDGETIAWVTFTAVMRQNDQDADFTEKSKFLKENGLWFYQSGDIKSDAKP